MQRRMGIRWILSALVVGGAATLMASQLEAIPRGKQEASAQAMTLFALSAQPPKGAVVLLGNNSGDVATNWHKRRSTDPGNWTMDDKGVVSPQKVDLSSRQEFGDSYVHAEYRSMLDASGKPMSNGNSGIGLQGRYEIQILNSYGQKPESHGCGALYSQKPPLVTACKPAGDWNTYDIIFRAPRFDSDNKVTEEPRATVFLNGVLVQNNEEFTGMTGINYEIYKEMAKTGPLVLQGDHDPVQFRNVWVVPLP